MIPPPVSHAVYMRAIEAPLKEDSLARGDLDRDVDVGDVDLRG